MGCEMSADERVVDVGFFEGYGGRVRYGCAVDSSLRP